MASDPKLAEILMVSVTWGAAVGVATDYSWSYTTTHIPIRNEDSVYPDAQGVIGKNLEAEVTCLHGPLTAGETPANLVCVTRRIDGTTKTETIANQILVEVSKSFNRDSAPATYRHKFITSGTATQP